MERNPKPAKTNESKKQNKTTKKEKKTFIRQKIFGATTKRDIKVIFLIVQDYYVKFHDINFKNKIKRTVTLKR